MDIHLNSSNNSHAIPINMTRSVETTNPRLVNGVVVLLMMVFNISGNSIVFYVYHYLTKQTVFAFFVRVLASLDILTAVTTMLIDVIMKLRQNDETELNLNVMCKLSHFQVYANSLICGCVLTLIAYQRYQKICHPLKRSIEIRKAKYILLGTAALCTIVSIPTIIVYGQMEIRVLVSGHPVKTVICRYDEAYKGTVLQLGTSYFLMFAFCVVLLCTIILYVFVARALRKFERRNSTMAKATSPNSPTTLDNSSNAVEIGAVNNAPNINFPVVRMINGQLITSPVHGRPVISPVHGRPAKVATPTPQRHPEVDRTVRKNTPDTNRLSQARASIFSVANNNMISAQMYRVFAVITMVFIISYLPHLVILILTKAFDIDTKTLNYGQRIALEFAYNCPYISTVANPLVYGFSSYEFRDHLRQLLYCNSDCCSSRSSHNSRR